jgi:hypothetical protein
MQIPQNISKYGIGLAVVVALRLLPHPPNVEPIMATMLPFAKKWGALSGMTFSLIAILGYDLLTGTLGPWSAVTAGTYAMLGVVAGLYLTSRASKVKYYLGVSIVGTIVYDAITGIGMGVLLFNQSLGVTVLGQIPFTLYHLAGNIVLAGIVSPALYRWVITNPVFETQRVVSKLRTLARS